jgi:hypothetical protein
VSVVDIKGNEALQGILAELEHQGKSIAVHLEPIGEMMRGYIDDMFQAEGPGWGPLKAATRNRKRDKGGINMILQDSGLMATSAEPIYGAMSVDMVFGQPYSRFHAPDAQGRDITDLGPFESPLLDEAAAYLADQVTR